MAAWKYEIYHLLRSLVRGELSYLQTVMQCSFFVYNTFEILKHLTLFLFCCEKARFIM